MSRSSLRAATYAACGAMLFAAGWLTGGISDGALLPVTAVLALGAAVALGIIGVRNRTMTSPMFLLGVPLLLSLAAAIQPITRIFGDWTTQTLLEGVLLVVAPLAGIGIAMLLTPGRTPTLERGTDAAPYPGRVVAMCLFMCLAGSAVYAQEWSSIGGPPLLSANIDAARFSLNPGPIHILTEGLPLAMLIAVWARLAHAELFSAPQRRTLEGIMCFVPFVLALSGGRSLVLLPIIGAVVVAARYVPRRLARRLMIVIPIGVVLFSSVVFIARLSQASPTGSVGTVLYAETGEKTSPLQSAYRALSINFGEQLRVIAELREADVRTPPFTSSLWFAHNVAPRAIDPHSITGPNAGGWLTSMYAGQLLLDFGLIPALLFGVALGAGAHVLYRRFARGRSVATIWIYAYLAGPLAFAFYINVFLYFIFPILDVLALFLLSQWLIRRPASHDAEVAPRPTVQSPITAA